jgi:flagellar protein FlbD
LARALLGVPPEALRMVKLTRLNNHIVAINPDHIAWADTNPDTTLFFSGGEKIIVRESLDELIALIIDFRRQIRVGALGTEEPLGMPTGDPPRFSVRPRAFSDPPRPSLVPLSRRGGT